MLHTLKKKTEYEMGFTCGSFDLLHPGHLLMLKDCKKHCDFLVVGLQVDPSVDRPAKNKPIETLEERHLRLESCKYVDQIMIYRTEEDLLHMLKALRPDIRFIGVDHQDKEFTGHDLNIPIHWNRRDHHHSSSGLRNRIKNS